MKIILAIYVVCIFPTILVFESVHYEYHDGQWPKWCTFMKVWFTMPFYMLHKLYEYVFKNKK